MSHVPDIDQINKEEINKISMKNSNLSGTVARGAQFLDEAYFGWVDHINIDELNLRSCCKCILGQLFNGYFNGLTTLGLLYNDLGASDYGFDICCIPNIINRDNYRPFYDKLRDLWLTEIRRRKNG